MHSAKHSFRWAGAHRCVPIALAPTFASWRLCSDAMVWRCLKGIAHDLSARLRSPDVVSYITASPRLSQTSPGNDSDLLYYILCQYVYIIYIYQYIRVYMYIHTLHYNAMQYHTIHYTALHYIHTCIYIYTRMPLNYQANSPKNYPRQTKKWRQAKARQKHCSYQGSNFCSSAPTQILPFLPFLRVVHIRRSDTLKLITAYLRIHWLIARAFPIWPGVRLEQAFLMKLLTGQSVVMCTACLQCLFVHCLRNTANCSSSSSRNSRTTRIQDKIKTISNDTSNNLALQSLIRYDYILFRVHIMFTLCSYIFKMIYCTVCTVLPNTETTKRVWPRASMMDFVWL